jgi:hypothetical protein
VGILGALGFKASSVITQPSFILAAAIINGSATGFPCNLAFSLTKSLKFLIEKISAISREAQLFVGWVSGSVK